MRDSPRNCAARTRRSWRRAGGRGSTDPGFSFLVAGMVPAGQPDGRACRQLAAMAIWAAQAQRSARRSRRRRPLLARRPATAKTRRRSRFGSQRRACPVTARAVRGWPVSRSGQAGAWPVVSDRSVCLGSGVKRARVRPPGTVHPCWLPGGHSHAGGWRGGHVTHRAIPGSGPGLGFLTWHPGPVRVGRRPRLRRAG
jgi:hypothetical protein